MISDSQDVEGLVERDMAFVEWAAYFGGLRAKAEDSPNARASGSLESWEKIETPTLEAFTQANQSLKTPKRLRLGGLQAVDVETLPMAEERLEPFSAVEDFAEDDDGDFLEAKIKSGLRTVFAEWNRLEATFNMIHRKLNGTANSEQRYREVVQKTMMEMQGSIREADARIQVLHAAIGQDIKASEDDTISVWEAIAALKRGMAQVTGTSELNAEFLTQARNSLPMIVENLAKLSGHYMLLALIPI